MILLYNVLEKSHYEFSRGFTLLRVYGSILSLIVNAIFN